MPYTLAVPAYSDLLVRKSRFIGCVQPASGREQAQELVNALWQAHPDATHICWALLAGGQSAAVDDGEPGGTAGRPMLEVLRHHDLEGVVATVVRYFGGVKLGAGGLVRAYTDAVTQALLNAEKIPLVPMCQITCTLDYAFEGHARYLLEQSGITLDQVQHGERVVLGFSVPQTQETALREQFMTLSQGKLSWLRDNT